MRTPIISTLAAATLVLSACGGGGASGAQGEAVDLLMESASEEGIDVDRDCAEDVASQLSDEDAEKIVEAGTEGDVTLSPEGEELTLELASCIDTGAMIDQLVDEIGEQEGVDQDCLRDVLKDMDPADLASGNMPEGLLQCIDLGG